MPLTTIAPASITTLRWLLFVVPPLLGRSALVVARTAEIPSPRLLRQSPTLHRGHTALQARASVLPDLLNTLLGLAMPGLARGNDRRHDRVHHGRHERAALAHNAVDQANHRVLPDNLSTRRQVGVHLLHEALGAGMNALSTSPPTLASPSVANDCSAPLTWLTIVLTFVANVAVIATASALNTPATAPSSTSTALSVAPKAAMAFGAGAAKVGQLTQPVGCGANQADGLARPIGERGRLRIGRRRPAFGDLHHFFKGAPEAIGKGEDRFCGTASNSSKLADAVDCRADHGNGFACAVCKCRGLGVGGCRPTFRHLHHLFKGAPEAIFERENGRLRDHFEVAQLRDTFPRRCRSVQSPSRHLRQTSRLLQSVSAVKPFIGPEWYHQRGVECNAKRGKDCGGWCYEVLELGHAFRRRANHADGLARPSAKTAAATTDSALNCAPTAISTATALRSATPKRLNRAPAPGQTRPAYSSRPRLR